MRLKHHQVTRPFALTAVAVTLAMAVALVWGAAVSFAAETTTAATYYEDSEGNLCVGLGKGLNRPFPFRKAVAN